jgi:hypothetical protein
LKISSAANPVKIWRVSGDRRRLFTNDLVQRIDGVLALESFPAGDRFVKNAAEGKNVRAVIDLVNLAWEICLVKPGCFRLSAESSTAGVPS